MHDFASFARLVHEAYAHLYDRAFLHEHPLAQLLGGTMPAAAERLHRTLVDAIEGLRPLGTAAPSSVEWRRYRHLQLRYLEGASPEGIARELLVSARQARRDHIDALDEIARLLWRRFVRTEAPLATEPPPEGTPPSRSEPRKPAASPDDGLEAELSKLAAATSSTPTLVDEVIRGVVETVSRLAEAHHTRITVDLQQPLHPVDVSRTVVRQLLLNLLADAIVCHPGGAVRVQASGRERSVDVVIGIGLDIGEETAAGPRLHRPRTRGGPDEGARSSVDEGDRAMVLVAADVLEVSRRLARSQGVTLLEEPGPDGPAVRVVLPAVPPRSLLVVDDNPDVVLLFRRYLADTSYRLIQARSAERALRLARELQPEVIFLDVLMPSPDGWEILQALRAEPSTARLPVVISSVLPDRALALSLGVDDFLPKPVTRTTLLEVLARLRRGREDERRRDQPESSESARRPASLPPG